MTVDDLKPITISAVLFLVFIVLALVLGWLELIWLACASLAVAAFCVTCAPLLVAHNVSGRASQLAIGEQEPSGPGVVIIERVMLLEGGSDGQRNGDLVREGIMRRLTNGA